MARPQSELTKFILSMPPTTLTAKEVVAKAKDRGMTTSEANVHRVRAMMKGHAKQGAKGAQPAKAAASAPKKAASTAGKGGQSGQTGMSKADFVRNLPSTMPAKEVARKAKASGLSITEHYVYKIRSAANKKGGTAAKAPSGSPKAASAPAKAAPKPAIAKAPAPKAPAPKAPAPKAPAPKAAAPKPHISGASSAEEILKAVSAELGLSRALAILENELSRIRSIFRR